MKAEVGNFVFLNDKFFKDFPAKEHGLMNNESRPFYFVADTRHGIYWLVPVSSRIEKYEEIAAHRIEKYGICDTVAFGDVNGAKNAFLLQNMFPVTEDYISDIFFVNGKPLTIKTDVQNEVKSKANKVLGMARQGRKVIFPDSLGMERTLLARMGITVKPPAIKPYVRGAPPRGKPPNQIE